MKVGFGRLKTQTHHQKGRWGSAAAVKATHLKESTLKTNPDLPGWAKRPAIRHALKKLLKQQFSNKLRNRTDLIKDENKQENGHHELEHGTFKGYQHNMRMFLKRYKNLTLA